MCHNKGASASFGMVAATWAILKKYPRLTKKFDPGRNVKQRAFSASLTLWKCSIQHRLTHSCTHRENLLSCLCEINDFKFQITILFYEASEHQEWPIETKRSKQWGWFLCQYSQNINYATAKHSKTQRCYHVKLAKPTNNICDACFVPSWVWRCFKDSLRNPPWYWVIIEI